MRTAEYPQIYLVLEGYSARVIRELYTHIAGGPTRLQASTRYINYKEFDYIIPPSIKQNIKAYDIYTNAIENIQDALEELEKLGIPKEDSANLLPLGMTTTIVFRTNLRNLIDMAHQRLCTRAYWEFRQLMRDIINALREYSNEWKVLIDEYNVFQPKCEVCGYCTEKESCGRQPKKENIIERFLKEIKKDNEFDSWLSFLKACPKHFIKDFIDIDK
jgi:thymidylate synthase (FAD)